MAKFRRRPLVVDASPWHKKGDCPGIVEPYITGGLQICAQCGNVMQLHGWIKALGLEGGHIVCPGDWIITGVKGQRYPCRPDIFKATYTAEGGGTAGARAKPKVFSEEVETAWIAFTAHLTAVGHKVPKTAPAIERAKDELRLMQDLDGVSGADQVRCIEYLTQDRGKGSWGGWRAVIRCTKSFRDHYSTINAQMQAAKRQFAPKKTKPVVPKPPPSPPPKDLKACSMIWPAILSALEDEIDSENFNTWVALTKCLGYSEPDKVLHLESQSGFNRSWLIRNYGGRIIELACTAGLAVETLSVHVAPSAASAEMPEGE